MTIAINSHRPKTVAVRAGFGTDTSFGSIAQPIHQTSTFAFRAVNEPGPHDYSRTSNPPHVRHWSPAWLR